MYTNQIRVGAYGRKQNEQKQGNEWDKNNNKITNQDMGLALGMPKVRSMTLLLKFGKQVGEKRKSK